MSDHLPVLIVIVPLLAALAMPLVARLSRRAARGLAILAPAAATLCALGALARARAIGPWHYHLGGWAPPWGIEYVIDALSGSIAVLVGAIACAAAVYAGPQASRLAGSRAALFDSMALLLTAGLLGIVVTGDLFNLYVFLEISSLSAYALLSAGGSRAVVATFRYLLLGTIAATFYLLGVGYLYALTGTLNMADLTARLPAIAGTATFGVAVTMIVLGLATKMAVFPLHGWQPDAYTYAPAAAAGFIAAVMSKVSAYALFRILYFVLQSAGAAGQAGRLLGWAGALAMIAGSVMALAQNDVRRMLAYSSVAQIGYILVGFSLPNATAMTGALLHLIGHAVTKGCLFLAVGGVLWQARSATVGALAGRSRRMPWTMAAFTVAALSMVGVPPTVGFFSKWYLLLGAVEERAWVFAAALVVSTLLGAVYFFRLIERAYFHEPPPEGGEPPGDAELPASMLAPILALGAVVLALGAFNQSVVTRVIQFALPEM